MRKVILQEWVSLDGFAADKDGSTDFFNHAAYNEGADHDQLAFLATVDTILLGANTYRMFAQFWPTANPAQEIVAEKVNTMPKLVFSQSLDKAPWGNWPAVTVVKADLVATVTELQQQPGKDLVLWGSLSVAQSLIRSGRIDEYQLLVVPKLLGAGRPLFAGIDKPQELRLLQSKIYPASSMLLRYARVEL